MAEYFQCIPLTTFDTSTLTGSYQAINGTGFPDPVKMMKFYNGGTNGVTISYDGVTDHDYFPAGSTFIIDLQANHDTQSYSGGGQKVGKIGQIIYATGTAGTGSFYISGYY